MVAGLRRTDGEKSVTNDTRTRVWMALFVALVFVCGLSLGLAAGLWFGPRPDGGPPRAGPRWGGERRIAPGPRAFAAERLLNRLAREDPALTDAQRARLAALLERRRESLEDVAREMRARFAAEQERLRAGAAEILSPAQMEVFDRVRRRRGGPWREPARPGR